MYTVIPHPECLAGLAGRVHRRNNRAGTFINPAAAGARSRFTYSAHALRLALQKYARPLVARRFRRLSSAPQPNVPREA